jgi:regulator of protease activity HflC (stomatin/prohibitin superfamily)
MAALVWVIVVLAVLAVIVFFSAIRVVKEWERLVVLRWGRFVRLGGPGLRLLIPVLDQGLRVDLREWYLPIAHQTCITKDNAPIDIDFLIYWKVIDAAASKIQVQDFSGASQGIATTTLRAAIGDISLDDVLAKREQINQVLRTKLDEVTERWGVKVTAVEIRDVVPPKAVQEAMNRQMAAERIRRAIVIEADGTRQAHVTIADGDRQAIILVAEGDRQAAILRAEGFAGALGKIFAVAQGIDAKTMSLQYFDTLKTLGASTATKFVLPLEFTNLLRPFTELASGGGAPTTPEPPAA